MIWIFLILSQLHSIYSFPVEVIDNANGAPPSFTDLELIQPPADYSPNKVESGNEKTRKIVNSYRAEEPDLASKSNTSSDHQSSKCVYPVIDHVSPDQRPPLGRPPVPPPDVEVFRPPINPGSFPNRPGLFPGKPGILRPVKPALFPWPKPLYPQNVSPDVEVFDPSDFLFPNVPTSNVEEFNPLNFKSASFSTKVAGMKAMPLNKTKSQNEKNDTSVETSALYSTLETTDELPTKSSNHMERIRASLYAQYERLLKFLDSEESEEVAEAVSSDSHTSSSPPYVSASNIRDNEPTARSYIATKMGHDFILKVYHDPPKICFHRISDDDYQAPEKCITFNKNVTSSADIADDEILAGAGNLNFPNKLASKPEEPKGLNGGQDKFEKVETTTIDDEMTQKFNEVYSLAEDGSQSTPENLNDIKLNNADDNLDDNDKMKKLIKRLMVEDIRFTGVPVDKTGLPYNPPTALPATQILTSEKVPTAKEMTTISTSPTNSGLITESNKIQRNYATADEMKIISIGSSSTNLEPTTESSKIPQSSNHMFTTEDAQVLEYSNTIPTFDYEITSEKLEGNVINQTFTTKDSRMLESASDAPNSEDKITSEKFESSSDTNQIYTTKDARILESSTTARPISEHEISSEKFENICRILAKYFVSRISNLNNAENEREYAMISPLILPFPYKQPVAIGDNAYNNEDLAPLLHSLHSVLSESDVNFFENYKSLPKDAATKANPSNSYLFSDQQPEGNMKLAQSYFIPQTEVILPYQFEGYV